jgi:hypothetical protein
VIRPEIAANPVQAKAQTRAIPFVVADSLEDASSRWVNAVHFTDKFNELLAVC